MPQFDGFGELGVKHFRLEVRQPRIILFVQIWHILEKKFAFRLGNFVSSFQIIFIAKIVMQ